MANADWVNAQSVYSLIFFGVPNRGIRISHWLTMFNNQPNEGLVLNLAPDSHYLRSLHDRFGRVFNKFQASRVVSVYQTLNSKTAKVCIHYPNRCGPTACKMSDYCCRRRAQVLDVDWTIRSTRPTRISPGQLSPRIEARPPVNESESRGLTQIFDSTR